MTFLHKFQDIFVTCIMHAYLFSVHASFTNLQQTYLHIKPRESESEVARFLDLCIYMIFKHTIYI